MGKRLNNWRLNWRVMGRRTNSSFIRNRRRIRRQIRKLSHTQRCTLLQRSTTSTGLQCSLDVTGIKAVDLTHRRSTLVQEQHFIIIRSNTILEQLQRRRCIHIPCDAIRHNLDMPGIHSMANGHSHSQMYPQASATVRGPSGEILILPNRLHTIDWMALWNSTLCGLQTQPTAALQTMAVGASNSTQENTRCIKPKCYSWNVTIPAGLTASTSFFAPILKVYDQDRVVSVFFNQTKVQSMGTKH